MFCTENKHSKARLLLLFKKSFSLSLGPAPGPSAQGLLSCCPLLSFCSIWSTGRISSASTSSSMASTASYLLRSQDPSASLDDLGCCPHSFCLMPLALWIEQLTIMAGDKRSLLYKPCKRFLVRLQDLNLKVVRGLWPEKRSLVWQDSLHTDVFLFRFPLSVSARNIWVSWSNFLFNSWRRQIFLQSWYFTLWLTLSLLFDLECSMTKALWLVHLTWSMSTKVKVWKGTVSTGCWIGFKG